MKCNLVISLRQRYRSMKITKPRPVSRVRQGTTTVEMAVVLPIMLLLVVGGMQIFRFYAFANNIELAVMEGARRGLLSYATPQDAEDTARSFLSKSGIIGASVNVSRIANASGQIELYISINAGMSGNGFLVPDNQLMAVTRDCRIRCEGN